MLSKFDDYPIHQTPMPIAVPETSDRNAYDRTWFNGYANDGSYYFGIGIAVYPLRGILDCAFSVVTKDGKQYCFYGSCRAPAERTDQTVGPFKLDIVEPMRVTRVTLKDNESGLTCDLTFRTRTGAVQEARQTLWNGTRRFMDSTRWDQFGTWEGVVKTPEAEIKVDPKVCRGTKDRSWGVRPVGEPETGGAPAMPQGFFFLWAPLFWEDHATNAIFFDDSRGGALCREGFQTPLYDSDKVPQAVVDPKSQYMATARHRVKYHAGTRLASSCEIDMIPLEGDIRTISLEPTLKFQMKGLGYGHPEWRQGNWKGELAIGHESFDPRQVDPLAPENLHVQQIVKATDNQGRTGIGVLEQIVIGPYAPAGFTQFLDGAKG